MQASSKVACYNASSIHSKIVAPAPSAPRPPLPVPVISRSQLVKGISIALGGAAAAGFLPATAPAFAEEVQAALSSSAAVAPLAAAATESISSVVLKTLSDCQLAVSVYPTFSYNAAGGGSTGTVKKDPATGLLNVTFDAAALNIPPIDYTSSKVLGVPIPPPLRIEIHPRRLEGTIDPVTGRADLEFEASFDFTAGPLYSAPPLVVETVLTTESSSGPIRSGVGQRLGADGKARLVGVARVPKTGDGFLDAFLMLPTDALAVLSAELEFK